MSECMCVCVFVLRHSHWHGRGGNTILGVADNHREIESVIGHLMVLIILIKTC